MSIFDAFRDRDPIVMPARSVLSRPPSRADLPIAVRWLLRRDFPDVLAVERASFARPWGWDEIMPLLSNRNCIGMVAEHANHAVGHMIYELGKREIDLLRFAVHPDVRGQRVGRRMLGKVCSKLSAHRRERVEAVVPEGCLDFLLFLRAHGFVAEGLWRDYFEGACADGAHEDGIHMVFHHRDEDAPAGGGGGADMDTGCGRGEAG